MGLLPCKGMESLDTERKSQKVICPAQLLLEGQGESQAAGDEYIEALLRVSSFSLPLLCLLSVPQGCCPIFTFSCAFPLSSSTSVSPIPASLSLAFYLILSVEGKLPRKAPSLQLWRKRLAPGDKPFLLSVGNK